MVEKQVEEVRKRDRRREGEEMVEKHVEEVRKRDKRKGIRRRGRPINVVENTEEV